MKEKNTKEKDFRDLKTFEDCCADQGKDPKKVVPYENPQDATEEALNAVAKLFVIVKAINGDWKADYENENQWKYEPRFRMKSGFGFSRTFCDYWLANSFVGSRLCFESFEKAQYAATQFESIYQKFLSK